eukprot:405149-Pelagomonas_calceolata.AAC.1
MSSGHLRHGSPCLSEGFKRWKGVAAAISVLPAAPQATISLICACHSHAAQRKCPLQAQIHAACHRKPRCGSNMIIAAAEMILPDHNCCSLMCCRQPETEAVAAERELCDECCWAACGPHHLQPKLQ